MWVAGLKAQIYSNLTISLHVESLCVQADRSGSSSSLTSERVTGRKAVGLQMGEIGFKCQAFFLSLKGQEETNYKCPIFSLLYTKL